MKKLNVRTIVFISVLVALHIVLSRFLSINTWNMKIGFAFVPIFVAAYLFGPVPAALVGALGDFLGAIMFPIGPYFPGITLSCALTGVVFGLFLHKKQTPARILGAVLINQFGISLFITTLWISILSGSSYLALLATRAVQAVILMVVESVVIFALSKVFSFQLKTIHT